MRQFAGLLGLSEGLLSQLQTVGVIGRTARTISGTVRAV